MRNVCLRVALVGLILLLSGPLSQVEAAQASCTFSVQFPTLRFGPALDLGVVRVTNSSTCAAPTRAVTSTVPWLVVGNEVTTAPTTYLDFLVAANTTGSPRVGAIVIDGQAAITITQGTDACVTAVTPASASLPAGGGEATLSVQTSTPDCFWSVSGLPPPPPVPNPLLGGWLVRSNVNVVMGSSAAFDVGSALFVVAAASNAHNSGARAATLAFGGSGPSVTVLQAAPTCQFTFAPNTLVFPANGSSLTTALTGQGTDCSYAAQVGSGTGVRVTSGATGVAPASVTLTMDPNPFPNERRATVVVGNAVLALSQAGPPVTVDSGGRDNPSVGFGAARLSDGTIRVTAPEQTRITNEVDPAAAWNAVASQPWIVLSRSSGLSPDTIRISIDPAAVGALQPGSYSGTVDIFSSVAPQTPRRIQVSLAYYGGQPAAQGTPFRLPPWGSLDTPASGATGLAGSIAITGWALDQVMITGIRVYRAAVAGEGTGEVFIGDATRVLGARPDIAPGGGIPEWRIGGYGYLLLSNVLPNGGNGTFTFSVYADDIEGNHTLLGRKTVTIDNAHATNPFGTIDAPAQGQTVSGTIVNRGWVLTPAGKVIPVDGTTINVFIDGTLLGPVSTYNVTRPDVKAYFPGLANSDGPEARLTIDTTQFADGLHTIAWGVVDDTGAAEGIGSRFFTIRNGSASLVSAPARTRAASELRTMAPVQSEVWAQAGVGEPPAFRVRTDGRGERKVVLAQGAPLHVLLDRATSECATYEGHLLTGGVAAPLPAGASVDEHRGLFSWQPTPEFTGTYRFVFVQHGCDGLDRRIPLSVVIGQR
jgi:hypothetical protein